MNGLLEQYKELCHGWRHDDSDFSRFTNIFFATSILALVAPYLRSGVPAILTCGLGFVGVTYWFPVGLNFQHRSDIRWKRIREIEKELCYEVHLRIYQKRTQSSKLWHKIRHRHWRLVVWIIYVVAAGYVLFDKYC